jgi:hypothetical protein
VQADNAPWRRRSSTGAAASASNTPTGAAASSSSLKAPMSNPPDQNSNSDLLVTPSEEDTLQLLSALQCIKLLCSCGTPSSTGSSSSSSDQHGKAAAPAQCVRNCFATATPAHLRALSCCLRHPSAAVRTAAAQVCSFTLE